MAILRKRLNLHEENRKLQLAAYTIDAMVKSMDRNESDVNRVYYILLSIERVAKWMAEEAMFNGVAAGARAESSAIEDMFQEGLYRDSVDRKEA